MRVALIQNCDTAIDAANERGAARQVNLLRDLLVGSSATINVRPKILASMSLGIAYRSYHEALDQKLRLIAERAYHAHRSAVDAKVHPGYGSNILNAALSPDGRGLANYGEVTLRLRDESIADRSSVLCENAFAFYERFDLGRRDAEEPDGWRSTWVDRSLLGLAQVARSVSPATPDGELSLAILTVGAGRDDDRYIEVHIYGRLDCVALADVSLDRSLTDADDREEWALARQKIERRGIAVHDRVGR